MILNRKFRRTPLAHRARRPIRRARRPIRSVTTVSVAVATAVALALLLHAMTTRPASSSPLWGTLDTQPDTAATEDKAGVTMAMFEFDWASFEPAKGLFSASYLASMKDELAAYQAAGMRVTLGLGTQNAPSWVFSLANSTYTDQDGNVSTEADWVFSAAVRSAAVTYMDKIAADFPLTDFWAIRLTSGGDPEMLYPGGGTYWAFNQAALTGSGLAAGMTRNPYPTWKPGTAGLTPAQIDTWVNWYIGGLDNVTDWQMQTLSRLGFAAIFLAAFTSALQAYPQAVHTKHAWLSRDFGSTCPHAEHRWLVKCGLIFWIRPGAFSSRRRTSRPQPDRMISRFSPAFCRTFRPGSAMVPLAERVMLATRRSSTRIRSNRRARSVEVFSAQSRRASASPARSFAMARFTRVRRFEPRLARTSLRWRRRSLRWRARPGRGTVSICPVDSAALTATPRSTPTTSPLPGPGIPHDPG